MQWCIAKVNAQLVCCLVFILRFQKRVCGFELCLLHMLTFCAGWMLCQKEQMAHVAAVCR